MDLLFVGVNVPLLRLTKRYIHTYLPPNRHHIPPDPRARSEMFSAVVSGRYYCRLCRTVWFFRPVVESGDFFSFPYECVPVFMYLAR